MAKKTFGKRLYEIRNTYKNDKGKVMSIRQFADFLGVNFATYNKWESDTANATSSNLIDICNKCNVSADYLLGLSDESTRDLDLKAVCEYTGLSENAVKILHNRFYFNYNADEKTFEKQLNKIRASIEKGVNYIISLMIEECDFIYVTDYEGKPRKFYFSEEEFYPAKPINPIDRKSVFEHASNLLTLIGDYIDFNIPNINTFVCLGENNDLTIATAEYDEEYGYSVLADTGKGCFPAKDMIEAMLFDSIKEELKKLRKTHLAREKQEDDKQTGGE